MKKLDTTIRIKFKMPSLYREDLEEIESTIKAIPNQSGLKIRTGNFEYDQFSEIADEDRSVKEVVISSNEPYINLSLNKASAEIYGSGKDAAQITGVVKLIADIVKKRERKIRWANSQISPSFYSFILTSALLSALSPIKAKWFDRLTHQQLIILIVFTLILIVTGLRDSFFFYSSANFTFRSKKVNWLTRNKDQILVSLINTIVSGVIGYFIGTSR
jgi:hypothetical protein